MPWMKSYKATALRPCLIQCKFCGISYYGWLRTEAISDFHYSSFTAEEQARERLAKSIDSGKASWEPYPCRCPNCRRFQPDSAWLVKGAYFFLFAILLGVTIAILMTREAFYAYFYSFAGFPLRSLWRFYRQKPYSPSLR